MYAGLSADSASNAEWAVNALMTFARSKKDTRSVKALLSSPVALTGKEFVYTICGRARVWPTNGLATS